MRWVIKTVAPYVGSGLWFITQTLWGDQIVQWVRQVMPDLLQDPVAHTATIAHYAFVFGPMAVLAMLGTYFLIRGMRGQDDRGTERGRVESGRPCPTKVPAKFPLPATFG